MLGFCGIGEYSKVLLRFYAESVTWQHGID